MDYEKAYKASLKTAAQWIKDGCTDKEKICLECVFLELRESEDERIRKWLLECVENLSDGNFIEVSRQDVLFYLEKQKEQKSAGWKPQPESLEALMYAIEGKWNMIPPTSYLSRRLEDLYEGLVNTFNVNETLLAELPKTAYTAEDIEELRELKHKIEASMEQKPAEGKEYSSPECGTTAGMWSEEGEMYLSQAIETLEHENHLILADKLKSLRPSWKPSEEQMKALYTAAREAPIIKENGNYLYDLYDHLKKLI